MLRKRILHVALVLFGLWLLLSGHYTGLLLTLGALSAIALSLFCTRLGQIHQHDVTVSFYLRLFRYLSWLVKEIVISNIDVAKRIWSTGKTISPSIIRVKATQDTDLGLAIHANSITLTPGTLTLDTHEGEIEVHALADEIAELTLAGDMDARVKNVEGKH